MQINSVLQAVQESLPPDEWPFVFEALRQDTIVWTGLQDPERSARILAVKRVCVQDWSPASLALSSIAQSPSLASLMVQPPQPLEPGLCLQAMRTLEAVAHRSELTKSLELVEQTSDGNTAAETPGEPVTLEQAGYLALALRDRFRSHNDWNELIKELHNWTPEKFETWRTPLAILLGMISEPIDLLRAMIRPDQVMSDWELGLHAMLSNPNYPSAHLAQLQAVMQDVNFTPEKCLVLLRYLAVFSPSLAQETAAWLMQQDIFNQAPGSKGVLEACQEAIQLAEIQSTAGAEAQALITLERARDISKRLQAELESAWAYLANNIEKEENQSPEFTQKLTEALRKSVAALPRQPESADILSETKSFLSEVLLQTGDSDETHKWLETLAEEPSDTDFDLPLADQPPGLLLQAARLAQQAGEYTRFNELMTAALKILEQPPAIPQAHSLKQRLQLSNQHYAHDLTELTQLAAESGQVSLAKQAARLALKNSLPDPADLVNLGEVLFDDQNPEEATSVFELAVGLLPAHLEARRWLATGLETQGQWEAALPHRNYIIYQLQYTNQLNSADLHALGRCAHFACDYPTSIKADLQAIEANPEDLTAHLLVAKTYGSTGEYAASSEHYRFVTQSAPGNAEAWLGLAENQNHQGNTRNAVETLHAAAQALPDHVDIHLLLGQILLQEQALTPALASLEKAYTLSHQEGCGWPHPARHQASLLYGQVLAQLGRYDQARDVLAEVYSASEPDKILMPEAARQYALVLLALDEKRQALQPLETALSIQPDQPDLHLVYARTLLDLKADPSRAYQSIQKALQADPTSQEAKGWIAVALDQLGQVQAAFQAYQQALESGLSGDPEWHARLLNGISHTALTLGKPDLALASAQDAVQIMPMCVDYQQQLTEVFWVTNLPSRAHQTAHLVLQLDQNNPDILAWYADQIIRTLKPNQKVGKSILRSEDQTYLADGINVLHRALELQPKRADLYTRLARLQILSGQPDIGIDSLQRLLNFETLPMALYQEAANLAEDAGNPKIASDFYRRAAQAVQEADLKSYGEILMKLAEAQSNAQNYHAALQTLRQAVSNNPADPRPYLLQAEVFQALEQPESVINCLESAIGQMQQPADQITIHTHLALEMRALGRYSSAYYHAVQAAELAVEPSSIMPTMQMEVFVLAAELAHALMLTDAAQNWLARAAAAELPSPAAAAWNVRMHCLYAELSLETGEMGTLAKHLEAGLQTNPSHPRLLASQARHLLCQNEPKQAEAAYQAFMNTWVHPEVSSQQATAFQAEDWLSISLAAADFAAWDQALDAAYQAQSIQPSNPAVVFNLARLHVQASEFQQLCTELEVVTHSPSTDLFTPVMQKKIQEMLRIAENLIRSARTDLQDRGIEIGINDDLLRWKMRSRQLLAQMEDPEAAEANLNQQEPAPWIETISDTASWLAALRQNRSVSAQDLQKILHKTAAQYPGQLPLLLQAALVHAQTEPQVSLDLLQQGVQANSPYPFYVMATALQARLNFQIGQSEQAAPFIEQALDLWPDEPRWHSLAASIQRKISGSTDYSVPYQHLEEAIRLEPKHLAHYLAFGELLISQPEIDPTVLTKATRLLERATRLHSNHPQVWLLLAYLQARDPQVASLELAAQHAERSIQAASEFPNHHKDIRALVLRADIALRLGQPKQAIPFIEHALAYDPGSSEAMLMLAQAYQGTGQQSEALKILERITPTLNGSLPLALRRIELLVAAGEHAAALRTLDQLAAENPYHAEIFAKKAEALAHAGAVEQAIQTANTALQISSAAGPSAIPLTSLALAHVHHLVGTLSEKAGQLDAALYHLNEAIHFAPANIDNYLELGQVFQKQRQYLKAQQILQQAMAAVPGDYRSYYQAALALKESKDYLAAESMLRRAVELAPENVVIRRQLAAVVALNLVHNPHSMAVR
jgi:tetratricopeptide (TPR) repeat protein